MKMKLLPNILLTSIVVQAHYTFPRLVVDGAPEEADWSVTRMTKNAQSKQGVENPASPDIRCYQSQNAPNIATVPAGSTIHYISTQQINHPGPTQYYLAKVPAGQSATTWDGSGAVWAKFHTEMPTVDPTNPGQLTWPGQNEYKTTNATIPESIADGEYLLRVEHIALHMAMMPNMAQFYLACSQIEITGGGGTEPAPLVSFPGAYTSQDPGILVDLNGMSPEAYQPPGPEVWSG